MHTIQVVFTNDLDDDTYRTSGVTIRTNDHGYESMSAHIQYQLQEAFQHFSLEPLQRHEANCGGQRLFDGRVEDTKITNTGIDLQSFGYWNALLDNTYTALWSTTELKGWYTPTNAQAPDCYPERYTCSALGNTLEIAAQPGQSYGGIAIVGRWEYGIPFNSSRAFVGIQFDFSGFQDFTGPGAWQAGFQLLNGSGVPTSTLWSVNLVAGGANIFETVYLTFAATNYISFYFYPTNGAGFVYENAVYGNAIGNTFVFFSNIRIVTSNTNVINTTISTTAGSTAATVGSSVGMYPGQRLVVDSGVNPSQSVVVASITNATNIVLQGTAPYTRANKACQAHLIYADEIVKDLISANAYGMQWWGKSGVSASAALIQSPGLDLTDIILLDQTHGAILDRLCALGDNQTPPRLWETGVWENQLLFFRPQSTPATQTWYAHEATIDIDRSITTLENAYYAVYQDASGTTIRSAITSDAASIARYNVVRTKVIQPQSTSPAEIAIEQSTALQDTAVVQPRIQVHVTHVYDVNGAEVPLWRVRGGDTFVIRYLPPTVGGIIIDRLRGFRVARTEYNVDQDMLTVEPGTAPALLDVLLAREVVNTTIAKTS